jgi:glycerophosphoryl diester phosphodiesterase
VSAHRGGPDEGLPENALTTFAHAAAAGSVIVECDVRRTADGVLALLHDDRLERTTTGKGHLSETPWAEAQALRLRMRGGPTTDHGIPTLAEALAWARGNAILTLDVKPGVPPAEVVEAIRRGDAAGCALVIVYTLEDLLAFTALAPELVYSVSVSREGDLEALLAAGVDTGRVVAFAGVGGCEAALLERLHARGIRAIVGTFGAIDERGRAEGAAPYAELLERGVDIIATDEPLPAVAATRAWRAAAPRD